MISKKMNNILELQADFKKDFENRDSNEFEFL
jgi:hypothetical protein